MPKILRLNGTQSADRPLSGIVRLAISMGSKGFYLAWLLEIEQLLHRETIRIWCSMSFWRHQASTVIMMGVDNTLQ